MLIMSFTATSKDKTCCWLKTLKSSWVSQLALDRACRREALPRCGFGPVHEKAIAPADLSQHCGDANWSFLIASVLFSNVAHDRTAAGLCSQILMKHTVYIQLQNLSLFRFRFLATKLPRHLISLMICAQNDRRICSEFWRFSVQLCWYVNQPPQRKVLTSV